MAPAHPAVRHPRRSIFYWKLAMCHIGTASATPPRFGTFMPARHYRLRFRSMVMMHKAIDWAPIFQAVKGPSWLYRPTAGKLRHRWVHGRCADAQCRRGFRLIRSSLRRLTGALFHASRQANADQGSGVSKRVARTVIWPIRVDALAMTGAQNPVVPTGAKEISMFDLSRMKMMSFLSV